MRLFHFVKGLTEQVVTSPLDAIRRLQGRKGQQTEYIQIPRSISNHRQAESSISEEDWKTVFGLNGRI